MHAPESASLSTPRRARRWLGGWALALSLVACGGGGGGDAAPPPSSGGPTTPPAGSTALAGTLTLPPGLPAANRFTVATAFGETTVGDTGAFAVPAWPGGQLATVYGPTGEIVMMARLQPGATTVSAASTAEVLLFYKLGLALLGYDMQEAALAQVRAHPAFAPLVAAIGQALASATPDLGVPAVRDALATAATAMLAAAPPPVAAASGKSMQAQSMRLDPTTGKSGVDVSQVGFDSIVLANNYRRRAVAEVERVAFKMEGQPEQSLRELVNETELSPVYGVTSVAGTLGDIVQANGAYAPVTSGQILLRPNPADAEYTKYRVTVLGCGRLSRGTAIGQLESRQRTKLVETCARAYLIDFLVPVLATSIMELGKGPIDKMTGYTPDGLSQDAVAILVPFVDKVLAGDLPGAINDGVVGFLAGNAIKDLIQAQLGNLFFFLDDRGAASVGDAASLLRLEKAVRLLDKIDAWFTIADSLLQIKQVGDSAAAETWDVVVTPSKVSLTPEKSWISPRTDKTVRLTAKVVDADSSTNRPIVYRWTQTAVAGALYDAQQRRRDEATFETLEDYVFFTPDISGKKEGLDTIKVEAFLTAAGDTNRLPLGGATATVETADIKLIVSPRTASNLPFESTTLTAKMVLAPGAPSAGQRYRFRWWTTGKFGRFDGALNELQSKEIDGLQHSVQFKSLTRDEGSDQVVVSVERVGDALTRSAEGTVKNELRRSVVAGSYVLYQNSEVFSTHTGYCAYIHMTVPKVEGAKQIQVRGYGFYDPLFWGSNVSSSFSGSAAIPMFDAAKCGGGPGLVVGKTVVRENSGAYWVMITGGGGGTPFKAADLDAAMARFHGMEVEGLITY